MQFLRQSTGGFLQVGPFVDSVDGWTLETAISVDKNNTNISKNDAPLANMSDDGPWVHDAKGCYRILTVAGEVDTLGRLAIVSTPVGARPIRQDYMVLSADAYDRQFGTSYQTRVNDPPGDAYTVSISSMADGTYKATSPIRLRPGSLTNSPKIGVDMSPQFGGEFVETVGTPTVSGGGSITAAALGPRDTLAVVQLAGTATADEEQTITMDVTLKSGDKIPVTFDVVVFTD